MTSPADMSSVQCRHLPPHVYSHLLSAGTWTAGPLACLSSAVRCTQVPTVFLWNLQAGTCTCSTGRYMPIPTASCWSLHALALPCSMPSDLCMLLHSLSHCTSLHSRHTSIHTPYTCLVCAGICTHMPTAFTHLLYEPAFTCPHESYSIQEHTQLTTAFPGLCTYLPSHAHCPTLSLWVSAPASPLNYSLQAPALTWPLTT